LLLALVLAGCANVPSVTKIGLIAPFEGLYRATGYAALDALRAAIDDCAPPGLAVVPLALDDAHDPDRARRAAQKLRADPAVAAVVGPLDLDGAAAVADLFAGGDLPWTVPILVDPAGGYPPFPSADSLAVLAGAVLETVAPQSRLVVVGVPPQFAFAPPADAARIVQITDPAAAAQAVQAGDAVLWFGPPAQAAGFQASLAERAIATDFWLGPQGDDPVFAAHGAPNARWITWTDAGYNSWQRTHSTATPYTYLVYRTACAALDEVFAASGAAPPLHRPWSVQEFRLDSSSVSRPMASR
jgi:branched-chain amino acid transport system substrate-binding protein